MEPLEIVLLSLLALFVIFILFIVIKALNFKPIDNVSISNEEIEFDKDKAVKNLQALVQCKTISYSDNSLEDEKEFEKLQNLLPKLYPNVCSACELKKFEGRALLYKWKGKSSEKPSVMMSHYDVVPVNEDMWEVPPFDGVIKDGRLWGRGTLDTKITLNASMTAADNLIASGFVPENDVYFAFSGGEEVNGVGALNIVNYFEANGIKPELVLDEGGAVVENVFPGVKKPCGLIGIAEKGMIDVKYTCKSNGGHASAPKPHTPVGVLSKACAKMESNPFKMHLTMPARKMFNTLSRHSSFLYKLIFANLWCFKWVLDILGRSSGGEINALVRTTVAFTQMNGSSASNVIPPEASMVSNIRLNPHDNIDSALKYIKKTVDDDTVEISMLKGVNPSVISKVDCDSYNKVASAVASTFKGAIVSPYLMVQCSDSRHYGKISDKVYRFSAADMTSAERASVHGNNESIRIETIERSVEFYLRLLKSC